MSTLFPLTYRKRQGKRKADRWGPCTECGWPGRFRCFRCKAWRCNACTYLRATPEVGRYIAHCIGKCRPRLSPAAAKRVGGLARKLKGRGQP
jgi:hypothetical protein